MISRGIIEGTGEDIAKYTLEHPRDRFKLILLPEVAGDSKTRGGPNAATRKEIQEFMDSLKGKMGVLHLEATTTEALYK